jgi:hypothetical protein
VIFGKDSEDVIQIWEDVYPEKTAFGTMVSAWDWRFIKAKLKGYYTVKRWVGTDVYMLSMPRIKKFGISFQVVHLRILAWLCNLFIDEHVFVSENLRDEFLQLFKNTNCSTQLWPAAPERYLNRFNVLVYLPPANKRWIDNDWLYGRDIVIKLMNLYPQWNWMILDGRIAKNVVQELYFRTNVVFRPTRHDGAPRMIKEAAQHGIPTVWSEGKDVPVERFETALIRIYWDWRQGSHHVSDLQ